MTSQRSWEQEGYGDVVKARRRDGMLEVEFANGDVIILDHVSLGFAREFEADAADGGAAVLVRTPDGEREIDWLVVRSASDPAFARELRERDAEEARRIGRRLRALRENRGITQKAAAAMVGMSSPQLAKLERGETDMRISTLRSILRALDTTFAEIAGPDAPEVSVRELAKRAESLGIPADLVKRLGTALSPPELNEVLARGFGWQARDVARGLLTAPLLPAHVVLKRRSTTGEKGQGLLTLAESLAQRSALAYDGIPRRILSDPAVLRAEILATADTITLASLLRWCWQHGIIVVPMDAKGGFSAGAWMIGDQPVVVIKESPDYHAHWLFALAHELGHLAHGHVARTGVIDIGSALKGRDDEQEERQANEYALDMLVPDRAGMLDEIRSRAEGPDAPKKFKWRAIDAAKARGYSPALVLLVAARGLPDVARVGDRWGSATEEAKLDGSARALVAEQFARNVDLRRLDRLDSLLVKELTGS